LAGAASDGAETIQKIRELNLHVIAMDIEMPRMNGIAALRTIIAVRRRERRQTESRRPRRPAAIG
jgi:two-component system chemotaxis response regulator CheB